MDTNKHKGHAIERTAAVSQTSRSGFALIDAPDRSTSFSFCNALRLVENDIAALPFLIRVDSRLFAEKK